MRTFTLTIRRVRDEYRVIAETSEPGLAAATRVDEPFMLDLASLPKTRTVGTSYDAILSYGTTLGNAAFVGRIGEAMQRAQSRADQAGEALHVLLAIEDTDLVPLRWERLCGRLDGGWQFLRLQQRTPFSFYLPSENDKRYPAISRTDLRALVVVASLGPTRPFGLADFDASETVKSVRAALGEIPCTVLASYGVEQMESADGLPTLDEICERITKERYPILHVVSHGQFKRAEYEADELKSPAETYLFLRKSGQVDPSRPDDHVHRVSATEFVHRLRMLQSARGLPHLTFLCSCDTASPEAEQGLGGLGQRLVRDLGMPAVVAMTEPVAISLSERLSAKFYERLHEHGSVDRALSEASAGVAGHGHVLVPELFSRLAGRKLFDEIGPLTTGQWEYGLRQVLELVVDRAPVLKGQVDDLADKARPALEIRKRTEHLPDQSDEMRRADDVLRSAQATLNELCQDFLENSFDHMAKGLPLAVPDYDGRCPFPGLGVFDAVRDEQGEVQEDFRPFFFGREDLTQKLLKLVEKQRFVAVLGGSGSGKSSLVRAGLLPEMREKNPQLRSIVFVPGKEPLARLEVELAATPKPDVIVVDQFEEIFTLVINDSPEPAPDHSHQTAIEKRDQFLQRLLSLQETCSIVVTMRADFLGECAENDELHKLLNPGDSIGQRLELLQPLKGEALRGVMEQQVDAANLQFEPGLAQTIFEEIEGEAGAMPLLQHCLRQLWQARHGRWLRSHEYRHRVGGVKGAISRTAEEVYEKLTNEDPRAQNVLRFIFERLTRIDTDAVDPEKRRDTRRREELSQLTWEGGDADLSKTIVSRLADAKLVITTRNLQSEEIEVEVAHETLIHHWKRLQRWLDDARITARLTERIRTESANYKAAPTEENLTLRGTVLEDAEALLQSMPPRLSENEAEYVRFCRKHQARQRDKQLKAATTRLRLTVIAGAAMLLACGLGWLAYAFNNAKAFQEALAKDRARHQLITNYAAELRAIDQHIANRDWAEGERALIDLAQQQDLIGFEWRHRWQVMNEYLTELDQSGATEVGSGEPPSGSSMMGGWPLGNVSGVSILENSRALATCDTQGRLIRWQWPLMTREWERRDHRFGALEGITCLAYCPATSELCTAGNGDRTLKIWDAQRGDLLRTLKLDNDVALQLSFSADGKRLAMLHHMDQRGPDGSSTMMGIRWQASVISSEDGKTVFTAPIDARCVAISPDGFRFAVGAFDAVEVFSLNAPDDAPLQIQLHRDRARSLEFDPEASTLAIGGNDVTLWNLAKDSLVTVLAGHDQAILDLCFSNDGRWLASASQDGSGRLWDRQQLEQIPTRIGHLSGLKAVAFSADSKLLATAGFDGRTRVWGVADLSRQWTAYGSEFAFSPSGDVMIAWDGRSQLFGRIVVNGAERDVTLVDTHTWLEYATTITNEVYPVADSPEGGILLLSTHAGWELLDHEISGSDRNHTLKNLEALRSCRLVHRKPSGNQIVGVNEDGDLIVVSISGDPMIKVPLAHLLTNPSTACFTLGNKKLAIAEAGQVILVDTQSWAIDGKVTVVSDDKQPAAQDDDEQESRRIYLLVASPNGQRVVVIDQTGHATLRDSTDWSIIVDLGPERSWYQSIKSQRDTVVRFSPDSRMLAVVRPNRLVDVLDTATGELLYTLVGHLGSITDVTFSPDGRRIATGDARQNIKLWETEYGHEILTLKSHLGPLTSVRFSPRGDTLVSAHWNDERRRVTVWPGMSASSLHTKLLPFDERKEFYDQARNLREQALKLASEASSADVDSNDLMLRQFVAQQLVREASTASLEQTAPVSIMIQAAAKLDPTLTATPALWTRRVVLAQANMNAARARSLINEASDLSDGAGTEDLPRAIALASEAIALIPDFADAYFKRGLAYFYDGDTKAAEADWLKVVELGPPRPYSLRYVENGYEVAHYNLACLKSIAAKAENDTGKKGELIDEAFLFLKGAIDAGFDDVSLMSSDGDLAIIRDDPRFQKLKSSISPPSVPNIPADNFPK